MKGKSCHHSGRSSSFALLARFTNDRIPLGWLGFEPLGSSRRFSSWLRGAGRRAQLTQKRRHTPSHLLQGGKLPPHFPGTIDPDRKRTSQDQLVVSTGNDVCPDLRLLRGAQTRSIPEQRLLVKAIAVLLSRSAAIVVADLLQRDLVASPPHQPALSGVAPLATGPVTDDLDQRDLDPSSATQVQLFPTTNLDDVPFFISALPRSVWLTMGPL